MRFVAISPNGKAVYSDGAQYRFVPLGRAFKDVRVRPPIHDIFKNGPDLFFADR